MITSSIETLFYIVAIPLGGYHWAREAMEDLFGEREVGIDLLMLAAAIGSCVLGMWDEAALLALLYGAVSGTFSLPIAVLGYGISEFVLTANGLRMLTT